MKMARAYAWWTAYDIIMGHATFHAVILYSLTFTVDLPNSQIAKNFIGVNVG